MRRFAPFLLLIAVLLIFRLCSVWWEGFPVNAHPLAALFFCAYAAFGLKGAAGAALSWAVCYPLLSVAQGFEVGAGFVTSAAGFAAVVGLAAVLPQKKDKNGMESFTALLGGSLASALLFYLLTNTFAWLGMSLYPKTWEGFYQAQWAGHPSLALPTWVFLKNSLLGNGLFVLLYSLAQVSPPLAALARSTPRGHNYHKAQ